MGLAGAVALGELKDVVDVGDGAAAMAVVGVHRTLKLCLGQKL